MGEDAARVRLAAARARLLLERPFIGALAMHLDLVPASARWCPTVATDARALYFSSDFAERAPFADVQFALAHAALHCALGHFTRRMHRSVNRWNAACDHAVNLLLIDDGMHAPVTALADPRYRGFSAEEIYARLPEEGSWVTLDRHIGDATATVRGDALAEVSGEPALAAQSDGWDDAGNEARSPAARPPVSADALESEVLAAKWRGRFVAAAQQARLAGRLAASWSRLVDGHVRPTLPWRALLATHLMRIARDDYGYLRVSRRDGDALLPRLSTGSPELYVAVDTSGSIDHGTLAAFTAEIDSLKAQLRARTTLLACDERIDGPWHFEPWEPLLLPQAVNGGGGTRFAPVFEWIERERVRPDAVVYFTDGEGEFPRDAPDFPVVWAVTGRAPIPWGERVQLD
jgi:predicted metal-dependent peptidase